MSAQQEITMAGISGYNQRQDIEVILNSDYGTQPHTHDGHKIWNLETEIVADQNEIMLVSVKKAFIPYSFYSVSSREKNTKLDVKETKTGTTNTYAITMDDGNYQITSLCKKLKNKLIAASAAAGYDFVYTCTYDSDTNKITLGLAAGSGIVSTTLLINTGTNAVNSIRRVIGFSDADVTVVAGNTIDSDNVVDCGSGMDGIHLRSNLPVANVLTNYGQLGNELLIIPVYVPPNFLIYYEESGEPFRHLLSTKTLRTIEFNLTDRLFNTLHFNGIPFTLILIFSFQFDVQKALIQRAKDINPVPAHLRLNNETNNDNIVKKRVEKHIRDLKDKKK